MLPAAPKQPAVCNAVIVRTDTKDNMGRAALTKLCVPTVTALTQLATLTALQPHAGFMDTLASPRRLSLKPSAVQVESHSSTSTEQSKRPSDTPHLRLSLPHRRLPKSQPRPTLLPRSVQGRKTSGLDALERLAPPTHLHLLPAEKRD